MPSGLKGRRVTYSTSQTPGHFRSKFYQWAGSLFLTVSVSAHPLPGAGGQGAKAGSASLYRFQRFLAAAGRVRPASPPLRAQASQAQEGQWGAEGVRLRTESLSGSLSQRGSGGCCLGDGSPNKSPSQGGMRKGGAVSTAESGFPSTMPRGGPPPETPTHRPRGVSARPQTA